MEQPLANSSQFRGETPWVLKREDLSLLFDALQNRGFQLVGPTVRDGAIVYDEIATAQDLPGGWGDEQGPGYYRLKRRDDVALFGFAVGPHSWKKFLFPAETRLMSADRRNGDITFVASHSTAPKYAFIGVRACELRAIGIQDRVFLGKYVDPTYEARRKSCFIVAVNCSSPAGTCFCASMNAGPKVDAGYDLALTELIDSAGHRFLVEIGTAVGAAVMNELPAAPATASDEEAAATVVATASTRMGRTMDAAGLKELLYANFEHPRWSEVAERCLTCANCTMACPTCFCSTVEDVTDLTGDHAERWRKWDSCFTMDFSTIAGGTVRASPRSRYRQWMTHKLATWHDQFGTSGCVGCGRCITWCPVGIDITEEVRAIRETAGPHTQPVH